MPGARRVIWERLERALEDNQIDPADFELQAVRVIEGASHLARAHDPASMFTAAEGAMLTRGGFDLAASHQDEPDVLLQTAAGRAVIEAKAATVSDVAAALHVTPSRVRQRASDRTLYAVRLGDEWRFPLWQFEDDGQPIRGVAGVAAALPRGTHPVAVWRFMSEPSPDLEVLDSQVSPIEWLRSGGDPEPVAAIAREL